MGDEVTGQQRIKHASIPGENWRRQTWLTEELTCARYAFLDSSKKGVLVADFPYVLYSLKLIMRAKSVVNQSFRDDDSRAT